MVHLLNNYVDKKVCVLTTDSRCLIGTLLSSDQSTNIILANVTERHIVPADSDLETTERQNAGVEIIRGATILVVGLVDEALETSIDWSKVRGEAIGDTQNA